MSADSPCVRLLLFPYTRETDKDKLCINPQCTLKWSFPFILKFYVFFLFSFSVHRELHTLLSDAVILITCNRDKFILPSRVSIFSPVVELEVN